MLDKKISADEGYVCVTPSGARFTVIDKALGYGAASGAVITEASPLEQHEGLLEKFDTKYYVAQDDGYVYLAIEQTVPTDSYTVNDVTYEMKGNVLTYLRLGFNPADYTQQVILYSDGHYASTGGTTDRNGVTYVGWNAYPFMVMGLSDNNGVTSKKGTATSIIENYVTEAGAALDSVMVKNEDTTNKLMTRVYEMKLSKAAI